MVPQHNTRKRRSGRADHQEEKRADAGEVEDLATPGNTNKASPADMDNLGKELRQGNSGKELRQGIQLGKEQ